MQTLEKETRLSKNLKTKDVTTLVKEFMLKVGLDEHFDIIIRKKGNSKFKPFNKKVVYITPLEKETQLHIGHVYTPSEYNKTHYMIEVDGVTSSYPISNFTLYNAKEKKIQPIIDNLNYTFTDSSYFIKLDKYDESIYLLSDTIMKTYQEYNKKGYVMDILGTFKYDVDNHQWLAITSSYKPKILQGEPKVDNTVFPLISGLAKENKIIIK